MADTAAQTDEQDFSIPGQDDDAGSLGNTEAPPTPNSSPTATPSASAAPSMPQVDTSEKIHPHVAILAGLVNKILGGIQNAPGNPNNALDRGFMAASPQNQQAQQANLSKLQSDADIAKTNASIAGLHLLLTKHMVDRLPQDDQDKYVTMSNDYYKLLTDKEGSEVSTFGSPNAALAETNRLNSSDPKSKSGLGTYVPLIHRDADNKIQASVVFIPHKDVLQNDIDFGPNPNYDPDKPEDENNQKELVIPAGTPGKGLPQFAKTMVDLARGDTKDQHADLGRLNKLPEDNPNQIQAKSEQLQQWVNDKSNESTFKKHNLADVQATIDRLKKDLPAAEDRKIKEAKAMSTQVTIPAAEAKSSAKNANNYYHWEEDGETKVGKGKQVPEGADATPIGNEDKFAQYQNEAHMSNIVQQSLNRVHQDIDQHPELFDNANARNILATTLGQIDRSSAALLVAGTGGSIPLPSGMGAMINTALQNKALDPTTADAVKQYIADYKAMKDKALVMQMEMQGGKVGRGSAQAFKSITDQIPNGETADSKTAHRQMNDLQETQNELSKKYGNFGDFKKIPAYKPLDVGASSTSADRIKRGNEAHEEPGISLNPKKALGNMRKEMRQIGNKEIELVTGKKQKEDEE